MHYGTSHFDFSMYTGVMLYSSTPAIKYPRKFPLKMNFKSLELFDTIKSHPSVDPFLNEHYTFLEEVLVLILEDLGSHLCFDKTKDGM